MTGKIFLKFLNLLVMVLVISFLFETGIVYPEGITQYLQESLPSQKNRKMVFDEATGFLIVTDTPTNHRIIKKLIKIWDVPPRQVTIEARFVEVKRGDLTELGIEWLGEKMDARRQQRWTADQDIWAKGEGEWVELYQWDVDETGNWTLNEVWEWQEKPSASGGSQWEYGLDRARRKKETTFFIGSGPPGTPGARGYTWRGIDSDGDGKIDNYVPDKYIGPAWSGTRFDMGEKPEGDIYEGLNLQDAEGGVDLEIGRLNVAGGFLYAYLKALEEGNKANLLFAPKITTVSGQHAVIQMIEKIPYASNCSRENIGNPQSPIFFEKYTVEEKEPGIVLDVLPIVSERNQMITLEIKPTVEHVVKSIPVVDSEAYAQLGGRLDYPVISKKQIKSKITIRSGETVILGGLIESKEVENIKKVPILGDIPLVGFFFRDKYTSVEKTNLMIFLTVTLISPEGEKL